MMIEWQFRAASPLPIRFVCRLITKSDVATKGYGLSFTILNVPF